MHDWCEFDISKFCCPIITITELDIHDYAYNLAQCLHLTESHKPSHTELFFPPITLDQIPT